MKKIQGGSEAVLDAMIHRKLLAVIKTQTPEQALASAESLVVGGMTTLEIPMTLPDAPHVIKTLAGRTDLIVGAGSVLGKEQIEQALKAEARFLACPVADVSLVPPCQEAGVVSVLGAVTPTEILTVHRAGADVVQVFPVEALGGPSFLRAVLGVLPPLPVMVKGGVTLENLPDYLGLPIQLIALGETVVVPRLVTKGVYAGLAARARDFVLLVERRKEKG